MIAHPHFVGVLVLNTHVLSSVRAHAPVRTIPACVSAGACARRLCMGSGITPGAAWRCPCLTATARPSTELSRDATTWWVRQLNAVLLSSVVQSSAVRYGTVRGTFQSGTVRGRVYNFAFGDVLNVLIIVFVVVTAAGGRSQVGR